MNKNEFKNYIEYIGFKFKFTVYYYGNKEYNGVDYYQWQKCEIKLYDSNYGFNNGFISSEHEYNDLKPLEKEFKKELRSIKLKQLLG